MSETEIEQKRKEGANSLLLDKLDKCVSLYIECYEQLLAERVMLDNCLDDAYLHLSKARSVMGCATLSITQIPNELEPSVRVDLGEQNHVSLLDEERLMFKSKKFDLVIGKSGSGKDDDNNDDASLLSSDLETMAISAKTPSKKLPLPTWFGVLTPLNLKTSHKSFTSSLSLVTSICELQSKLESLRSTYQELLNQQKSLLI
jgi:hypothetical protein